MNLGGRWFLLVPLTCQMNHFMKSCKHTLKREHASVFSVSNFHVVCSLIHSLNKYFWVSLRPRYYSWHLGCSNMQNRWYWWWCWWWWWWKRISGPFGCGNRHFLTAGPYLEHSVWVWAYWRFSGARTLSKLLIGCAKGRYIEVDSWSSGTRATLLTF